jgi:hypothetical protein
LDVVSGSARSFDRRERWLAALCFAVILLLAFPQVVFLGKSLVPSDNYNPLAYPYNNENYGPGFVPGEEWSKRGIVPYANFHDPGADWWQGEPALAFFRRALTSGEFPFWDPFVAGGAPAFNNPSNEFLFPPQIALCLAGATSAQKNAYILFLFWTAGFTTYCLLRLHNVAPIASAAGGLAFLFSGALQQIAPSIFLGQPTAIMPLVMLVMRLFLDQPSWRRTALLAATFAFCALASFPPILVASFGFTVIYFLCAVFLEGCEERKVKLLRGFVASTLSLGLVAVYYIPVFLTISQTQYVTSWYRTAGAETLPLSAIVDLLGPTLTPGAPIYTINIIERGIPGHLFYVGVAALLMLCLAFGKASGTTKTLLFACSICAGLVLLKIFGVPPVQWIAHLPVFQSLHYAIYFGILVAFALSLLVGIGIDRLLRRDLGPLSLGASLVLVTVLVYWVWEVAHASGSLRRYSAWRWIADYRLVVLFASLAGLFSLLAVLFRRRSSWLSTSFCALVVLVIVCEGIVNATYPRQRRWDVFAHPPKYVRILQKLPRLSRLFVGSALNANLGSAFGIHELDSLYSFSPQRMYELYQRYAISAAAISMREATTLPPDPVLDRAGISHVLARQQLPVIFRDAVLRSYPTAYEDDYVRLFRRDKAPPRYSFTTDYVVTDRSSALTAISTAPSGQVILESPPPFPSAPNGPADPVPEVLSARLNSVDLRVRAPRPGLLYLADAYYPGWKAIVNGHPAEVMVANYGFRAIRVPAGDIRVSLRYLPVGFIPGAVVSILSLGLVIALALRRTGQGRKVIITS